MRQSTLWGRLPGRVPDPRSAMVEEELRACDTLTLARFSDRHERAYPALAEAADRLRAELRRRQKGDR